MKHRAITPPRTPTRAPEPAAAAERLQKILAHAGIASRRAAEALITEGRVRVNGQVVTEMGVRADPATDTIEVDGKPLGTPAGEKESPQLTYIMLNKPLGVVATAKDPQGRPTVLDLVQAQSTASSPKDERQKTKDRQVTGDKRPSSALSRIYPVGRLDVNSTGLLLLTDDGDLTFRLTHPRFGVEKEYRTLVRGKPDESALRRLREGVEIEGETTAPAGVEETGKSGGNSWLRVVIHEGRKRQVRLMCAAVGHPVIELQRVRFGPLALGSLQPGKWRHLAVHEVHALQKAVKLRR